MKKLLSFEKVCTEYWSTLLWNYRYKKSIRISAWSENVQAVLKPKNAVIGSIQYFYDLLFLILSSVISRIIITSSLSVYGKNLKSAPSLSYLLLFLRWVKGLSKISYSLHWNISLREKCPFSELFWSAFFRIRTEYWEILRISLYSVRMLEKQTRITPKTDTFYAVYMFFFLAYLEACDREVYYFWFKDALKVFDDFKNKKQKCMK